VEEAVEHAASSLMPLMILLGVVVGVLIILAVVLRMRVQRDRLAAGGAHAVGVSARRGPAQAVAGDSLSVLGRVYRVAVRRELALDRGGVHFFELEGPARLVLDLEGQRAMCLPDRADPPEGEGFPERLERPEGAYVRQGRTAEEGDGLRLALYSGPQERLLLLELRSEGRALFRGKAVPLEGVLLVERD
jgi:hypothetical protein